MRELTDAECEAVNGAVLAQIGMAIGGASISMGAYALQGGVRGELTGSGFISAAVGGAVYGAGGFNAASAYAGALAAGGTDRLLDEC